MTKDLKACETDKNEEIELNGADAKFLEQIEKEAGQAVEELLAATYLRPGAIIVVGCSTSEIGGHRIGSDPSLEIANLIYDVISEKLTKNGFNLAAQCCEHLNRCLIVEREALPDAEIVNVIPWKKSGGAFASRAYETMKNPIAVEKIKADAGIDIGDTYIGMHLKDVVVVVRTSVKKVGHAHLTAARTRPRFVGGERAIYDQALARGYKQDK